MKMTLTVLAAALSLSALAGEKHWRGTSSALASVDANWAEGAAPVDGDDIILDADSANANLTWDVNAAPASWTQSDYTGTVTFQTGSAGASGSLTYGSVDADGVKYLHVTGAVNLQSGTWTHTANPSGAPQDGVGYYRLWVVADGAFTLGANATITAVGKGYRPEKGPGRASNQGGGSYGGRGGHTSSGSVRACYGSFRAPVLLGSGGSSSSYGSCAGGAIKIFAAGALTLNGTVSADASSYKVGTTSGCQYYAGSGGSVYLKGSSLTGTGTLRACGGAASTDGAGGGGRIAVISTDSDDLSGFTPAVFVSGGLKSKYSAAGGTYYVETKSDAGAGTLHVFGISSVTSPAYSNVSEAVTADAGAHVKLLVLTNNAQFAVASGASVQIDNVCLSKAGEYGCVCLNGGTLTIPGDFEWTAAMPPLCVRAAGSTLLYSGSGTTLTANGGTLVFDQPLSVSGDVVLKNVARLTCTAHKDGVNVKTYAIDLTVAGNLSVDATSSIDAVGKGFYYNCGPGKSTGSGNLRSASHGGLGYNPGTATCYGSVRHPVTLGSGGSYSLNETYGGGAIKVSVTGTTTLNGTIAADGNKVNHYPGAGGSVWLITGTLSGAGAITADGGSATASAPCGAGGRVSVQLTDPAATFANFTDAFDGAIHARAGVKSSARNGGGGTVYLQTGAQADGEGTLIVENPNGGAYDTVFGPNVTDTDVGDVIVRNNGRLVVTNDQTLTVRGALSNASATVAFASSATLVLADATRTGLLAGGLTIPNLLCEEPGKRIEFVPGETTTIPDSGSITLTGTAESPIALVPNLLDGTTWALALGAGVAQTMEHLVVTNSVATGGATALNSSGENTTGWTFKNVVVGETITWTGVAGDNWSDVGNWDLGRAPVATDLVAIPSGCANMPALVADATIWKLQVAAGAELKLNGFNLTVTSDASALGTITATDSETLAVGGNVSFASGGLNVARATLKLNGANQTVDLGGRSYWSIDCSDATAPSFVSSFTTRYFICRAAAAKTVTFKAGITVTVDELILSGVVDDAAALTLASDTAESAFNLVVRNRADVIGVAFVDCAASGTAKISARTPSSATRCTGITTGSSRKVWKAGVTGNFNAAANWEDGVAPTETDAVLITNGTVTVSAAATVRELNVGDGAVTLTLSKALGVTENAVLGSGATVVANAAFSVTNALILEPGSTITHKAGGTYRAVINVGGDCALDRGAAINLQAKGYEECYGPGASTAGSTGASHGGRGSGGSDVSMRHIGGNGVCYDSIYAPSQCGSGGNWNPSTGGGAVYLGVKGKLALNGTITANALTAEHYSGSGGAVHIEAGRLTGSGAVSANGGTVKSGQYLGTGGGGRIAITLTNPTSDFSAFTGTVAAYGGGKSSASQPGCAGAGTVYLRTGAQAEDEGTLIIDNGPNAYRPNAECRIAAETVGKAVGTVVISNGAKLVIAEGESLSFKRDWLNAGAISNETGSSVAWLSSAAGAMTGTNGFYNFSCTVSNKTLTFGTAGSLFEIVAGGSLTLQGAADHPLTLVSDTPGTHWLAKADASVLQEMEYLDVTDSDASAGATMVAKMSAGAEQNNVNWNFVNVVPGVENRWTGAAGTSWTDAGNWSQGRAPASTDNVVIPATANAPSLAAAAEVWSVTVEDSATLNLAGFNLSVSNLTVNGALVASGAETVTVTKDAAFAASSTFTAQRSTLLFTGSAAQTFTAGGKTFHDVRVSKDGGTFVFADALSSERLYVTATDSTTVSFAAGCTYAAAQVVFRGLVNELAALTLASGTPGSSWFVGATDLAFAEGVTVYDSTASVLAFKTPSPSSGERCSGWTFGVSTFTWTGLENTLFTNANNWAGGVVPGAGDRVWIKSAETVTIDAPVSLGEFYLAGEDAVVTCVVADVLSVAGSLDVGAGAVLVANTNVTVGAGLVVRSGGLITHTENAKAETNRIDLTVAADLIIEEGGAVDATGKGYGKAAGPGFKTHGPSHGGQGIVDWNGGSTPGPCYGSILHPHLSGSGGAKDDSFGAPGGGVAIVKVSGRLVVDGVLSVDGGDDIVAQQPGSVYSCFYGGAGGSLDIVCAALSGVGRISSDGGRDKHGFNGGGGRIALWLTEATSTNAFTGILRAFGGYAYDPLVQKTPEASSGTIYVQTAAQKEGYGKVTIADGGRVNRNDVNYLSRGVTYPVELYGDPMKALSRATFDVRDGGTLILTNDCTIGELELGSGSRLYLNNRTLTIRSRKHASSVAPGYRGFDGEIITGETGRIIFLPRPLIFYFY